MNKDFLMWLEKQEYDWSVYYNHQHKGHGGRIWMLKPVYNKVYPTNSCVTYRWGEIIERRK